MRLGDFWAMTPDLDERANEALDRAFASACLPKPCPCGGRNVPRYGGSDYLADHAIDCELAHPEMQR